MNVANQPICDVNCVIIGNREFKNWSAYGMIRLNRSRIHYFDGTEETFNDLMDSANDFDNDTGIEYFFVVLNGDYQKNIVKRLDSENFYLSFQMVNGLYVFDEVAYERMVGNEKLTGIVLGVDEDLKALSAQWKKRHNKYINRFKAKRFLEIFELNDIEEEVNDFEKYLENVWNASFNKEGIVKKKGTMAYAWSVCNHYIIHHLSKKDELSEIFKSQDELILNHYNELSSQYINPQAILSLTENPIFLRERQQAQEMIQSKENILTFTLYVHYKMLIQEYFDKMGEQIFLAIVKDIVYLKKYYAKDEVSKLVYWLAFLLPEIFISQMYFIKNAKKFSAVNVDLLERGKSLWDEFNAIFNSDSLPQEEIVASSHSQKPQDDQMMVCDVNESVSDAECGTVQHVNQKVNNRSISECSRETDCNQNTLSSDNISVEQCILKYYKTCDMIEKLESKIKESHKDFDFYQWYNEHAERGDFRRIKRNTKNLTDAIKNNLSNSCQSDISTIAGGAKNLSGDVGNQINTACQNNELNFSD